MFRSSFHNLFSQSKQAAPSLLWSNKQKVEHEKYKRKLMSDPRSKKEQKSLQEKLRDEGMAKPIDQGNKGFMLLQKLMKRPAPDTSQEQEQQSSKTNVLNDLIEQRPPIPIDIKNDRKGLSGTVKSTKRKQYETDEQIAAIKEKHFEETHQQFKQQRLERAAQNLIYRDFRKCQRSCYDLDQRECQLDEPIEKWYWPIKVRNELLKKELDKQNPDDDTPKEIDEEDEDELVDEVKLVQIVSYLRDKYYYCIWCACKYESTQELHDLCPGSTRTDHDDEM